MSIISPTTKWIILSIISLSGIFLALGYYNSYIGYFGYDKHKYRRYSQTAQESIDRNVFVTRLKFRELDSVEISNVFVERGYRWGNSSRQTVPLTEEGMFANNQPDSLFQLIVEFTERQGDRIVYIPANRKSLFDGSLRDTLNIPVYVRSVDRTLTKIDTLKVWNW